MLIVGKSGGQPLKKKKLLETVGIESDTVYESLGCAECDYLGYRGRVGIFELLEISSALRALIITNPQFDTIYNQAIADGMQTLVQDGAHKVKEGVISLAEYARVFL